MKELLNYYYYILPDKILIYNNYYYFNIKNNYFIFYKYNYDLKDLDSLYNLNNYMIFNNYQINKIILNKDRQIITKKDNMFYILILLNINSKEKININNILNFSKVNVNLNILNRTNWYYLWINKIDNIEYERKHLRNKYPIVYNSLPYYIGLTENAISLLKYSHLNNDNYSICHRRVSALDSLIDFYNPLNLVIDYKVRDIAEYYKSLFFSKMIDIKDIINSFKKINMSYGDYLYFYIRMLYPSYYFDMFDLIINDQLEEKNINNITNLQNDYEYLLYEIYLVIRNHFPIVGIEWINKKFAN